MPVIKKALRFIWHLPRKGLMALFRLYQKVFSPDHSFWSKSAFPHGYCPFQPTCSQYMIDSLQKHGAVHGLFKGMWRIFRCHPWTEGGVDEA